LSARREKIGGKKKSKKRSSQTSGQRRLKKFLRKQYLLPKKERGEVHPPSARMISPLDEFRYMGTLLEVWNRFREQKEVTLEDLHVVARHGNLGLISVGDVVGLEANPKQETDKKEGGFGRVTLDCVVGGTQRVAIKEFKNAKECMHELVMGKMACDVSIGVLPILKYGISVRGFPFLVTPQEGVTLWEFLSRRHITPVEKIDLLSQLVKVMGDLHTAELIHGDLKGNNLLVCDSILDGGFTVKVIDFSLTVKVDHAKARYGKNKSPVEIANSLKRSYWLAPEFGEGARFSKATDVYALGFIVMEVLMSKGVNKLNRRFFLDNKTNAEAFKGMVEPGLVEELSRMFAPPQGRPTIYELKTTVNALQVKGGVITLDKSVV